MGFFAQWLESLSVPSGSCSIQGKRGGGSLPVPVGARLGDWTRMGGAGASVFVAMVLH